ncbi:MULTISPECIES: universal stress protein [unclassified Streptomyces]|uniref:universal stress protein n=1 Tax=unclassified Streptomyces TaxID=2593676 RepID=UPI00278BDEF9|nr:MULTISPECIES: universal stress protein [unclassified Streptomyces]
MTKPVVVGVDGSRPSLAAADWGARTALRHGLPLRLVHAWESVPGHDIAGSRPSDRVVPQYWARRVLRGAMEHVSERYPQLYISAEQVHRPPRQALLSEAEGAELLVIGNEGLGGIGGLFSGTVALSIVAHSPLPVVLVRAGFTASDEHERDEFGAASERTAYRDVVAAVELGRPCDGLLSYAFDEAAGRGAALRAVHVQRLPLKAIPGDHVPDRSALEELLRPWREKYPTVPVTAATVHARAPHEIVHASEGAGLLVVGRGPHHHPGLGAHPGAVTHAVIHHVACPVAFVPHA